MNGKESAQNILRTLPWFEGLPDQAFVQLASQARVQRFPAGTVLFLQGETPDACYVALEGSVELYVTDPDQKESLVEISNAPNAYTMAAVLTAAPYLVSCRTATTATMLMVDAPTLRSAVKEHAQLGLNLLGLICWQFRTMVRQVIGLKGKSTSERLGCYLLALSTPEATTRKVTLPLDRKRLAAKLGMTTMSLSRAFKTLSEHGVELRGNIVTIKDPDMLCAHSRPDHSINEAERELRVLTD
jgi:CRP/FNR family transcriptional activator FtrB